jgi:hypothetical protein
VVAAVFIGRIFKVQALGEEGGAISGMDDVRIASAQANATCNRQAKPLCFQNVALRPGKKIDPGHRCAVITKMSVQCFHPCFPLKGAANENQALAYFAYFRITPWLRQYAGGARRILQADDRTGDRLTI